MKPHLSFLLLSRDILTDISTYEISAIRIFDYFFLKADENRVIDSFYVVGRIYFNLEQEDRIDSSLKITIINPDGTSLATTELNGKGYDPRKPINLNARFNLVELSQVGKYFIKVQANINGGVFFEIPTDHFFSVVKI